MPPEVFEIPAQFSDKVDIFSFGCVTISTLTHQWPEPGPAKRREGGKVIGLTECQRREQYLAVFTLHEKEMFLRLTEQCLNEDPSSRPSSGAIVEELARIRDEARKGSTGETVRRFYQLFLYWKAMGPCMGVSGWPGVGGRARSVCVALVGLVWVGVFGLKCGWQWSILSGWHWLGLCGWHWLGLCGCQWLVLPGCQ